VLGANYDLVVRSLDGSIEKGQGLIEHMKTLQKDWEGKLAAAVKATSPGKP
jgi:hypothetical protein